MCTVNMGPLVSNVSHRKDWGIENFISPTLLRNMKGKDIKKAISFHMKRNQNLLEPRQKVRWPWPLLTCPVMCCETLGEIFNIAWVLGKWITLVSTLFFCLIKQLISAAQLRLNYLQILGELKTYGGKVFNATLMVCTRPPWTPVCSGSWLFTDWRIFIRPWLCVWNMVEGGRAELVMISAIKDKMSCPTRQGREAGYSPCYWMGR